MFKRRASRGFTVIQALIGAVVLLSALPALSTQAAATRIMPLGDSITGSPGCWRALLWNRLQSAGYSAIDFVGTLPPQGCGVAHDGDNEGHGGELVTNVANQNLMPGRLAATNPDIVLMHFGTNDVWSNIAPTTILNAYSKLVDQMRANNPNMKIVVAQIIPMNPSTCPACGQRVVDLNAAIPGWASAKSTAQSPIIVVDQWTGFSTSADTYDGVHPNSSGDQKMSDKWYPALVSLLGTGATSTPTTGGPTRTPTRTPTPGTPTPTASPTRTPTASPTALPGACQVTYTLNDWGGGFTAEVRVTNLGASISNWSLTWSFAGNQTITNHWNATVTQSGRQVTARAGPGSSTTLPAGGSQTFGFQASYSGTNARPTDFALNGSLCNSGTPTATSTTGPTRTSTVTASPTRTPTASPTVQAGGCQVMYTLNDWGGGFTADVRVTNLGASITNWTLTWSFAGNQTISGYWNATVTQSGQSVTARNHADWNATIPTGGSQTFGFQASYSGTNARPVNFALNGRPCSA